jgi:hypothetical protein
MWTNAVDQGVDYYVVDSAGQRLAVIEKTKVLPHSSNLPAQTKHLSLFLLQNDEHGQW